MKRIGIARRWPAASTWPPALLLAAACGTSLAQAAPATAPEAALQVPLRDPWVPPEVRAAAKAAPAPPRASGAALRAQVEDRLRVRFEAAAADAGGRLTAEQAKAAGLGWLAEHFERIDQRREGRVGFDDVQRYLRAGGAAR